MENWQFNLTLIPSIAFVLTSANRMALGLTDEINVRISANIDAYRDILPLKIKQLKRLSISIVLMYISLAVLIINALVGALYIVSAPYDRVLMIIAITVFLIAIMYKIQFSYHAYIIRQNQFNYFKNH
ncbi:MAG: hypothetical protein IPL55_10325 [Saprospiraceae bacterium]|jgi:hypothetical protein|nr:hypothetical protein [Saprospiraceae bacterium]